MKTISTSSLKIFLYFTLFKKKIGNREQRSNSIMNFLKLFFVFKNKKSLFNCATDSLFLANTSGHTSNHGTKIQ